MPTLCQTDRRNPGLDRPRPASIPLLALRRMIRGVAGLLLVLWPAMAFSSDLTELEKIIDEARLSYFLNLINTRI